MSFDELAEQVNDACIAAFGQAFTFTPSLTGIEQTITGILESVELEARPPGDGSTYMRLFFQPSALAAAPVEGDEVASATAVYKVIRIEQDEALGGFILLRKDRDI